MTTRHSTLPTTVTNTHQADSATARSTSYARFRKSIRRGRPRARNSSKFPFVKARGIPIPGEPVDTSFAR